MADSVERRKSSPSTSGAESTLVTIGTFDGVHLGHQHLLQGAVSRGGAQGWPVLAVTFEPLPPQVLRPDRFSGRICDRHEKLEYLRRAGVDDVLTLPFTRAFAQQSPESFMAGLVERSQLRELWVGEAFALGKDRVGDVPRLDSIGRSLGYHVVAVPRLAIQDEVVSSSAIRAAVQRGDVAAAARFLGRPFRTRGEVIHGAHFGRTIGFPTANVQPPTEQVRLADGIYVSWAHPAGEGAARPAMTYVGTRPTVNTGPRLVETYLLDFEADLYGQELVVDILDRLRPDAVFPTVEAMVHQLREDESMARSFFRHTGRPDQGRRDAGVR